VRNCKGAAVPNYQLELIWVTRESFEQYSKTNILTMKNHEQENIYKQWSASISQRISLLVKKYIFEIGYVFKRKPGVLWKMAWRTESEWKQAY
jgi:hypothetical protein